MIPFDLKNINEQIVSEFFQSNRVESLTHDYKREIGLTNSEKEKVQFLKNVTSFANAQGGDLIVGIDEQHGLTGIPILTPKEEENINNQIHSIINQNVDPPLQNFRLQWVPLATGNKILIIRIWKSYLGPHRIYKEGKDFWSRGESGKFSLRVPQLKMLFTRNNELANNINEFIGVRTSEIVSNRGYFNINAALPTLILHIIPIQHFEDGSGFDFYQIYQNPEKLVPLANTQQPSSSINFQGFGVFESIEAPYVSSYSQIFFNGAIESVNTRILGVNFQRGDRWFLIGDSFAKTLFTDIPKLLDFRSRFDDTYPIAFYLQFFNVRGVRLIKNPNDPTAQMNPPQLVDNVLKFNPITIEKTPKSYVTTFKPWLDSLWRAFGQERCFQYISDEEFKTFDGKKYI